MKEEDYILWENPDIYDGWCCKVYEGGRIEWREAWFTDRLSKERLIEEEKLIRKQLKK